MTLIQEFETQWSSLVNSVTAEMLQASNDGKAIPYDRLVEIFNNEKKRWTVRGQYQYAWFEMLDEKDPEAAKEFIDALGALQLEAIEPVKKPTYAMTLGLTAAGAAAGFAAARIMGLSTLIADLKIDGLSTIVTVLGALLIGSFGFGIGRTLQSRKLTEALVEDSNAYKVQLQEAGKDLAAIVIRADR